MGNLILIKHSKPTISSSIPSCEWTLSEEGINKARLLATPLRNFLFNTVYSSIEPKAIETAEIIGKELNKQVDIRQGIHEHERHKHRKIYPEDQWKTIIREFFDYPNDLVFGQETAASAQKRFDSSVGKLLKDRPANEDIVIVAHGTVISLFIDEYNQVDVMEIWNSLGLPAYAVLDAESFRLYDIVNMNGKGSR
ncbi:histidine phosphatase family protein [Sediminibacillus albus]|uniref:Broad specificity phosphatase PhoE n=1 Tax=Sediminibacillus albus TaxID=407036 RepID=A0A1G8WP80_9BACI|nr:histidine phosphatase family protein [Sediminibacillus albus]SDJ79877.1 Broad specificity phosphatase PhoE [Sediminibacillus albus]